MKKVILFVTITLMGLGVANLIQAYKNPSSDQKSISGEISQGYRILKIENTTEKVDLKVYRGDYIKFDFDPSMNEPSLFIPKLSINQKLTRDLASAPFFKMKKTGRFPFSLGRISGYIRDILIYCATGNRSTVASKILNDSGFKQIYNLRYGIYSWSKEKFPVIR